MEKEDITKSNIFTQESEKKQNIIRILKGSLFSILVSAILLLIFAIVLTFTNITETTIVPVISIITGISILIGSMISTKKIRKNGLLNGGIVGIIYVFILYLISSIYFIEFKVTFNSLIMLVIGIVTGMLGGIIGVNINKR